MPRRQAFKPEPPKKAMCAFFLYRMDIYPLVKERFPGHRITELTREIGQMWKSLEPEKKEMYERKASEERSRVLIEKEQYEARYGKPESKKKRKRKLKKDYEVIKRYLNSRDNVSTTRQNGYERDHEEELSPENVHRNLTQQNMKQQKSHLKEFSIDSKLFKESTHERAEVSKNIKPSLKL